MLKILSQIESKKPGITYDGYEHGFRNAIYSIKKVIQYHINQKENK